MEKITLKIDGMACGMCEAHVNEAVRRAFKVKKITSSHKKGTTEIISETAIDKDELTSAIEATGYTVLEYSSEPYTKKGFFPFGR